MYESDSPGAPLVERAFGAPERGVAAPIAGGPPVVRGEDYDSILVLASFLEGGYHLAGKVVDNRLKDKIKYKYLHCVS